MVLISLDNYIPKKISSNVAIIAKKNNNSYSLTYLLKHLFQLLTPANFNLLRHICWKEFDFSKIVLKQAQNLMKGMNIKNLIINY